MTQENHEHIWIKQWDRRRCALPGCGAEEVFLFPETNEPTDLEDSTFVGTEEDTQEGEQPDEQPEEKAGDGAREASSPESKGKGTRRKGTAVERGVA